MGIERRNPGAGRGVTDRPGCCDHLIDTSVGKGAGETQAATITRFGARSQLAGVQHGQLCPQWLISKIEPAEKLGLAGVRSGRQPDAGVAKQARSGDTVRGEMHDGAGCFQGVHQRLRCAFGAGTSGQFQCRHRRFDQLWLVGGGIKRRQPGVGPIANVGSNDGMQACSETPDLDRTCFWSVVNAGDPAQIGGFDQRRLCAGPRQQGQWRAAELLIAEYPERIRWRRAGRAGEQGGRQLACAGDDFGNSGAGRSQAVQQSGEQIALHRQRWQRHGVRAFSGQPQGKALGVATQ